MSKNLATTLLVTSLLFCGCKTERICNKLLLVVVEFEEILREENTFSLVGNVINTNYSRVRVYCEVTKEDETPLPRLVQLCIVGRCERTTEKVAFLDVYPEDFDELSEFNYFFCAIIIPKQPVWNSSFPEPVLLGYIPEKYILEQKITIQPTCVVQERYAYCSEVGYDSNGNLQCTSWS